MIKHINVQELAGTNEVASHLDVGFGRGRIAAWVIVHQHNCCGVGGNGKFEYFARVNENHVDRALGNLFNANRISLRRVLSRSTWKCSTSQMSFIRLEMTSGPQSSNVPAVARTQFI